MKPCMMAGGCHREATVTVRIAGVGDRPVCREHHEWMVSAGMDIRELPAEAFVPLWRQHSLARDTTGRVLGVGRSLRGAA